MPNISSAFQSALLDSPKEVAKEKDFLEDFMEEEALEAFKERFADADHDHHHGESYTVTVFLFSDKTLYFTISNKRVIEDCVVVLTKQSLLFICIELQFKEKYHDYD